MPKAITDAELLNDISAVAEEIDGPLTRDEYDERGNYTSGAVYNHFESWNEAKALAGLETLEPSQSKRQNLSPDGLNKEIRRQRVDMIKSAKDCELCGDSRQACAMDFHHINSEEKELGVSELISRGAPWTGIVEEMNKCLLVCANCHREIEHGSRGVVQ